MYLGNKTCKKQITEGQGEKNDHSEDKRGRETISSGSHFTRMWPTIISRSMRESDRTGSQRRQDQRIVQETDKGLRGYLLP